MSNWDRVLSVDGKVEIADMGSFQQFTFAVPADATRLTASLDYVREDRLFLHLQLFDAQSTFRGRGFSYGGRGAIHIELPIWRSGGPPWGIPGPLGPGEWIAEVEVRTVDKPAPYQLQVLVERNGTIEQEDQVPVPSQARAPVSVPGWVRGDLHVHTDESDGRLSVAAAVAVCRERGLDYVAFAEHNTSSGWRRYAELAGPDLVIMRAEEMSTGYGHSVAVGLKDWWDWRVGRIGDHTVRTVNDGIREVRQQGGLFFPAHPFIPRFDWRFVETDWSLVDALEVWSNPQYPGSPGATLRALGFWDGLLRGGHRIVAVGGSDAHRLTNPWETVGIPFTFVYVEEFTEAGILEGIRRGRVYVTLGPEMDLYAASADAPEERARMGDDLAVQEALVLTLDVRSFHGPFRALLFRDGMLRQRVSQPEHADGCFHIEFQDTIDLPAYYRVEIHQDRGRESEDAGTLQAFGNPIYVHPK